MGRNRKPDTFRPVSQNALTKIVTSLGLNATDYEELGTPKKRAPAPERTEGTSRANQRRVKRAGTKTGPPPQRKLTEEEEVQRVQRILERTLRIWSRMSDIRQVDEETWYIPPDVKYPEEISREATRGAEFSQQRETDEEPLIELQPGLVLLKTEKTGQGNCTLRLVEAELHGPRP